ncbi:acyltransferase family protein [Nocardioides litoris]|uniref:acyltransferase family protein n=1 Tax=Nocardioides litoris TaxID=1926648 RepID=UPI00111E1657|nr:acyltransferase [Nocardioides litoris]
MSSTTAPTLAEAFDSRRNVLNALRLVLAAMVVVKHAHVVITGSLDTSLALGQVSGALPVDGFFALSGFLITGSWLARPDVRGFLLARAARIFPAFWVCLVMTVCFFAPLARLVATGEPGVGFGVGDGLRYVLGNSTLVMVDNSIGGTPTEPPYPAEWNASLWTLKWEFLCYLGLMVLGLTGVLARRRAVLGLLGLAWVSHLATQLTYGALPGIVDDATRFFLMYMTGVALHVFADRVRVTRVRAFAAVAGALLLACVVPGYRLLGAPLVAYGLVGVGVLFTTAWLRLRNDVSYGVYIYGFPVEQVLAHSERARDLGLWWFSAVALVLTLPFAVASWFLVERPVHRWAARRRARVVRDRLPAAAPS